MRRWEVKRADRVEDEDRRISFPSVILGRELNKSSGWQEAAGQFESQWRNEKIFQISVIVGLGQGVKFDLTDLQSRDRAPSSSALLPARLPRSWEESLAEQTSPANGQEVQLFVTLAKEICL